MPIALKILWLPGPLPTVSRVAQAWEHEVATVATICYFKVDHSCDTVHNKGNAQNVKKSSLR